VGSSDLKAFEIIFFYLFEKLKKTAPLILFSQIDKIKKKGAVQ
jgi:hypothetical protein